MSDLGGINKTTETNGTSDATEDGSKRKGWVKFEDDSPQVNVPLSEVSPSPGTSALPVQNAEVPEPTQAAVLKTESVHINLDRNDKHHEPVMPRLSKNVEFVNVRQGFCKYRVYDYAMYLILFHCILFTNIILFLTANGDIIVTLLPVNSSLPWITAARFRPELVPEELMAQGLTVSIV